MSGVQPHEVPLSREVDLTLLDAEGRVTEDVPCIECRYNLRTLPARGRCPECGHEVAPSLYRTDLACAPREWLRRLNNGAGVLCAAGGTALVGVALLTVGAVVQLFGIGVESPVFNAVPIPLIGLVAPFAGLIGLHLLTAPDPRPPRRPEGLSYRRAARWSVPGGAILVGATLAGSFQGPTVFLLFAILCAVGLPPTLLLAHTMELAQRSQVPRLAAVAKLVARSTIALFVVLLVGAALWRLWFVVPPWGGWRQALVTGILVACVALLAGWLIVFIRMERVLRAAAENGRSG